jgi:hypothetical protein
MAPLHISCEHRVVRFRPSHPAEASTFANVGIKGPPENVDSSGALDLTFACERAASKVANVKSAPPKRDEFRMNRHRALALCLGMIFSENRFTLFRIMP